MAVKTGVIEGAGVPGGPRIGRLGADLASCLIVGTQQLFVVFLPIITTCLTEPRGHSENCRSDRGDNVARVDVHGPYESASATKAVVAQLFSRIEHSQHWLASEITNHMSELCQRWSSVGCASFSFRGGCISFRVSQSLSLRSWNTCDIGIVPSLTIFTSTSCPLKVASLY